MKTIFLHRHSDKTPCNKHISTRGRNLAKQWGKYYVHIFKPKGVSHVFFGPLIRTAETAYSAITGHLAFDSAEIHADVDGLGSDDLFGRMVNDGVKTSIKDGMSVLEAVEANHDKESLQQFAGEAILALNGMFDAMKDDQTGVGFFHDPTIPLLAKSLGLEDARSLNSMESIMFVLSDDGNVTASWPTCFKEYTW